MNKRKSKSHGLSTVVATIILISTAISFAIAAYALLNGVMMGQVATSNLSTVGSYIEVHADTGDGLVYIKLQNFGPGAAKILAVVLTNNEGALYGVWFAHTNLSGAQGADDMCPPPTADCATTVTLSGSAGVGVAQLIQGRPDTGMLVLPSGGTVTIIATFNSHDGSDIRANFAPGVKYHGYIKFATGSEDEQQYVHFINDGATGQTINGFEIPITVQSDV